MTIKQGKAGDAEEIMSQALDMQSKKTEDRAMKSFL